MPLTFLQRRSTLESTNAWATAKASTPGVLSPVDTPSSVKQTPSIGDDVLRWCLAEAVETPPPVSNDDGADADAGGRLKKAGERQPRPLPRALPVVPLLPLRDVQGRDARISSTKCIGGRAPGVQISTSPSSTPHVDVDVDVDVDVRHLEKLLLLLLRCWFSGGTIPDVVVNLSAKVEAWGEGCFIVA